MAEGGTAGGDRKPGVIGRSLPRLEDPPLVAGLGNFAADISFPRQLVMRVVRAGYAHGRITAIDTAAACAAPGVVAVWTAAEVADVPPVPYREGRIEPLEPYRQPVLARDIVRYVGEPVAAVFAEDAYLAEDAADLVQVAIEPLPTHLAAEAPPVEFAPGRSSEALVLRKAYGDLDAAFHNAHRVIALELSVGRHSGVPLETRGAIARWDQGRDLLELHGAAKVLHRNRAALAALLGRPEASIQLHEGNVGGGFGIRGELYPEDILVCVAALRLRRPIKWIEDRREHLIAANHSRQQLHRIRAAVDRDGHLLGVDDDFFLDQGAYPRTHAARVVDMTAAILPGPYRIPAYRAVGHYRLTNKTPAATYRSPGRYESTFVRERLMDAIAAAYELDPIELRRRNLIAASEMPYVIPIEALGEEVSYDNGDYAALLDQALDKIDWPGLQETLARRRAAGEAVGVGVAVFVEKTGLGPRDGAHIIVDPAGGIELITGGASVGQGFETTMAQICADTLGVDYRRVRVTHGHTDRIEFGLGAHASRATVMSGGATHAAALAVREKAIAMAAELMQAPAETLDIIDGRVIRKDRPAGPSMSLGEIAASLAPTSKVLGDRTPGLSADGWFHTAQMTYPYGVHLAVVRVDRETGATVVERFLIAYDIGRAVNPMLVEGQLVGGFAQGMGGALFEEFLYDPQGEPLSVTFADYLLPTLHEVPPVDILLTEDAPSPRNPLGIKGAGEGGITAVAAAIAQAIDDAIGIKGAITTLPVTPQRLKAILDRAAPQSASASPAG